LAASKGFEDLVIYLVGAFKIDVNSKNFAGNTPVRNIVVNSTDLSIVVALSHNAKALQSCNYVVREWSSIEHPQCRWQQSSILCSTQASLSIPR
jgi:hypothetical protein